MLCRSTTLEPSSGVIGSGGASAYGAVNVAKFGNKATMTGAGLMSPAVGVALDEDPPEPNRMREVDSPQREVGETAAVGAVGSGRVDEDTKGVTTDVHDFTRTDLEDSILADKEDIKLMWSLLLVVVLFDELCHRFVLNSIHADDV